MLNRQARVEVEPPLALVASDVPHLLKSVSCQLRLAVRIQHLHVSGGVNGLSCRGLNATPGTGQIRLIPAGGTLEVRGVPVFDLLLRS